MNTYEKQQALKKKRALLLDDEIIINVTIDISDEDEISSETFARIERINSELTTDIPSVENNKEEAEKLLLEFKEKFNENYFDELITTSKNATTKALIMPFGLAGLIFQDKNGGNVTTVNNAKQGIYAKENDHYKRKDYTHSKNSDGMQFAGDSRNSVGSNHTQSQMDSNGMVLDEYHNVKVKANTTSPDHIESISDYHKAGGFMQSNTDRADFATDTDNLALTNRGINSSMKDRDKLEWAEDKQAGRVKTNKEHYEIDEIALKEAHEKGKATAEKHLPTSFEKGQYYIKNAAMTGAVEGVKMGLQQSLGILMVEFVNALHDELKDVLKQGLKGGEVNQGFFDMFKKRCNRIVKKLLAQWKNVVKAFKEGVIAGFFSNIITVLINTLVTTSAKAVKAIREGSMSAYRALNSIVNKPEDMSKEESYHEASKILAMGSIVTINIMLDEALEKAILSIPILGVMIKPYIQPIKAVVLAIVIGVTSAIVVYILDKIDLFGVNHKRKYDTIIAALDDRIDTSIDEIRERYGHLTTVSI